MTTGPIALALDVARTLDALGIPYVLGGSLASSIMGEPRSTVDIDMAIRLDSVSLEPLLEATRTEFYVPEDAARAATETASSFNMVHRAGALKVDLFVLGDGVLDRRQLARRVRMVVSVDPASELWVTSAEDQVLRKLEWYRSGGGVSDRQWRDVVGILSVQSGRLDVVDLTRTAEAVGLGTLFSRALGDVEAAAFD